MLRCWMSERPPIPEQVREALADSYTPKGVEQVWQAHWRSLNGERLCDVWPVDPQRCLDVIESMNQGDYV
jgi:hypothetical protein